jgi:hypothetical protein
VMLVQFRVQARRAADRTGSNRFKPVQTTVASTHVP